MMDYEKEYKEALERARKLYNEAIANGYTSDKEDYETIFPQLRESDDEKVRKYIIKCVNENMFVKPFNADGVDKQTILAWLERQKSEWSEEDRKLIDDTCKLINTLASGYGEKVTEPITFSGCKHIADIKERLRALVDNNQIREAYKNQDEVQYQNGYEKGYNDALAKMPHWRSLTERSCDGECPFLVVGEHGYVILSAVKPSDTYLLLSELEKLPTMSLEEIYKENE